MNKEIKNLHDSWCRKLNITGSSRYQTLSTILGYAYSTMANWRSLNEMHPDIIDKIEDKINSIIFEKSNLDLSDNLIAINCIDHISHIDKNEITNNHILFFPKNFFKNIQVKRLFLCMNEENKPDFNKGDLLIVNKINKSNIDNGYYYLKLESGVFLIKYIERQISDEIVIKSNQTNTEIELVQNIDDFLKIAKAKIITKIVAF